MDFVDPSKEIPPALSMLSEITLLFEPGFKAIGNELAPEQVMLLFLIKQLVTSFKIIPCLSVQSRFIILKLETVAPEAPLTRTTTPL